MNNNVKDLLPIGSIVLLKGASKKIMIIGVKSTDITTNEVYDYLAVPYPEGYISDKCTFFVKHEAIDKVFFKGFEDDERNTFIKSLYNYYEEIDNK